MNRRVLLLGGAAAAIIALALVALFVVFPSGASSSEAPVLNRIDKATPGSAATAKVLARKDWGSGQLVLVGYDRAGERKLGLAFVKHGPRGWRLGSYTEETVDKTDVVIGSLLLASSEGGAGQPAWSAAVGELGDPRVARVEVAWSNGDTTVAPRVGDAYLVTEKGTTTAKSARYVAKDGVEIAKVPINS